jgi:hypothetical protein
MATLTRKKRPKQKGTTTAKPVFVKFPAKLEIEAPDQGERNREREAPENPTLHGRLMAREAPDAGIGRPSPLDSDFTHGRSQS